MEFGGVWRTDAEILPVQHVPVPPEWDFSHSRPVEGMGLDHCFDGWDGNATVTWPSRGLRLVVAATEAFRHLVIYVPDGQRYFCVEPVSHVSDAIHGDPPAALGLRTLQPGEPFEASMMLEVTAL